MGSLSHESFEEFLDLLKAAGNSITRENELREPQAQDQDSRYAFMTLAANGRSIGIRFQGEDESVDEEQIRRTLAAFQFPESSQQVFTASIQTH